MTRNCIACGMPMQTAEEHAMGDAKRDYCVHCARPDGSMQSRQEKLDSMSGFLVRTEGMSEADARRKAAARMSKLPAWTEKG
jgi:hypothetical protein